MPLESERFKTAIDATLDLSKWYAREHVVLCLLPAFFIAGVIAVFISQAAVLKYFGANAKKWLAYSVDLYLNDVWDYVITVCSGVNEACPSFPGKVNHRLHMGFDNPSEKTETEEYLLSEFRKTREDIKALFFTFYVEQIKPQLK